MNEEQLKEWYAAWCKATGRSGGVLIGGSIRELLLSLVDEVYLRGYIDGSKDQTREYEENL